MKCETCGHPAPVRCIECGAVTHHLKSKRATSGNRYQVRECDAGHTTVVTHDGQIARKYSRALESDGMPSSGSKGSRRSSGGWAEIRA